MERVRVSVRIRPVSHDDDEVVFSGGEVQGAPVVLEKGSAAKALAVDYVFDGSSNADVFDAVGQSVAETVVRDGYSAAVLAYGQTGSGKTHTVFGANGGSDPGLVPRIGSALFALIAGAEERGREFLVRMLMVEVYNERIYDLGGTDGRSPLKARLDALMIPPSPHFYAGTAAFAGYRRRVAGAHVDTAPCRAPFGHG